MRAKGQGVGALMDMTTSFTLSEAGRGHVDGVGGRRQDRGPGRRDGAARPAADREPAGPAGARGARERVSAAAGGSGAEQGSIPARPRPTPQSPKARRTPPKSPDLAGRRLARSLPSPCRALSVLRSSVANDRKEDGREPGGTDVRLPHIRRIAGIAAVPPGSRRWHRWRRRAAFQGERVDAVDRVVAARQAELALELQGQPGRGRPRGRGRQAELPRASRAARCDRARSCDPAGGAGGDVRRARARCARAPAASSPHVVERGVRAHELNAMPDLELDARRHRADGCSRTVAVRTPDDLERLRLERLRDRCRRGVGFMLLLGGSERSRCAVARDGDDGVSAASAAAREGGPQARPPVLSAQATQPRLRRSPRRACSPSARRGRSTSRAPPPPLLVGRTTPGSRKSESASPWANRKSLVSAISTASRARRSASSRLPLCAKTLARIARHRICEWTSFARAASSHSRVRRSRRRSALREA